MCMYACMGTLRLGSGRGIRVYVCVYGYTEIRQWEGYTCVCMRVYIYTGFNQYILNEYAPILLGRY